MRFSTYDLISTALTFILLDIAEIAFTGGGWIDSILAGFTITAIYECIVRGIVWYASKRGIYIRKYENRMSAAGNFIIWIIIAFCYPIGSIDFYFSLVCAACSLFFSPAMVYAIFKKKIKKKA